MSLFEKDQAVSEYTIDDNETVYLTGLSGRRDFVSGSYEEGNFSLSGHTYLERV